MVGVIAHVAGPSGSGKTELADVLSLKVSNIALIDLDIFDGQVEHTMNISEKGVLYQGDISIRLDFIKASLRFIQLGFLS